MTDVHNEIFALSAGIRYVALAHGQHVEMRSRPHLEGASASDSDRYEELLVNPTLLTMARQRGEIDCGGLSHLIVGYRHFHQLVVPLALGHVSIAFDLDTDPVQHLPGVFEVLARHGREV